jgi:hypothetical protein
MNYSIGINHELKIICYTHPGVITDVSEIGLAWEELLKLDEFTKMNYNLLSDYRESKFSFSVENKDLIVEFLFTIRHLLQNKKQALVLDDPRSTALSVLFERQVYERVGFLVKVFSSKEYAIKWLTA